MRSRVPCGGIGEGTGNSNEALHVPHCERICGLKTREDNTGNEVLIVVHSQDLHWATQPNKAVIQGHVQCNGARSAKSSASSTEVHLYCYTCY